MRGVYVRRGSPFYWVRFYDKLDPEPKSRRKSINTKIEVTAADRKRGEAARREGKRAQLTGTPALRRRVEEFRLGLAERNIAMRTGVRLVKTPLLSEGYAEFKQKRTVPGMADQLKAKTLAAYDVAVGHLTASAGDKQIRKYSDKDYENLLRRFEEIGLSMNSRSIYSRSLRSLWNHFIEANYAGKNIIKPVSEERKDPAPIPLEDVATILSALRNDTSNPHHFWFISFMLLTGCRPSSAIMQLKENVDLGAGIILIENVKTSRAKCREFYPFPIHAQLANLLQSIGINEAGRLFDMYAINEMRYTSPLSFWKRLTGRLKDDKKIRAKYSLKQLRPTFISYAVNVLGMNPSEVQKLVDHSDVKVTDQHYLKYNILRLKPALDRMRLSESVEGVTNSVTLVEG